MCGANKLTGKMELAGNLVLTTGLKKRLEKVESDNRSDEGLTLETSAFLPFTVANLRFQPSC